LPQASHAPSPAPQSHPAQRRNRGRSRTVRSLLVTTVLAGGAVLLLIEVVLLVMPPAICPGPAGASGSSAGTGGMAGTLAGYRPAAGTLLGRAGACKAQFTISAAIQADQADLAAASPGRRAPGLPPAGLGQQPAAGDEMRGSRLQYVEVRTGPGWTVGAARGPSGGCGIPGCTAVMQLVTAASGEPAPTLIVSSQPSAQCRASQAAAPSIPRRHP
jgi:hypothetical protein